MSLFGFCLFFFFWGNIWFVTYVLCIHHYIFTAVYPRICWPQKFFLCQPPYSDSSLPLAPSPLATTTLASVSTCLFLLGLVCFLSVVYFVFFIGSLLPQMSEIIQYLSFCMGLLSLSLMPLRSIQLSQLAGLCLFIAEHYAVVSKYVCVFLTSLSTHTLMGTEVVSISWQL